VAAEGGSLGKEVPVAESVRERDLRGLLGFIEAARSTDVAEGLPIAVLDRARKLVVCDEVAFVEYETAHQIAFFEQSLPAGNDDDPGDEAFWRHYWDCLPCCYPDRSGDDRSITTISDFYTKRQLHNTGMYADCFGPRGVEHEAMLCISAPAGRSRRLIFFRGPGADFDGRDRLVLSLLRPHLNELYQELERCRRPAPDLTPRQWELLHLVASGRSNAEIARELVVSKDTVRKHMENIFARLDVTNRTAAVAQAFPAPPY
jgi:DNA-binding CsgD family transcriptional regulator